MRTMNHDEINHVLNMYVSYERLPYSWKGTVLDLLEYKELPIDARVSATLICIQDKHWVLQEFAKWCESQVVNFSDNPFADTVKRLAKEPLKKGNANLIASNLKRAYYQQTLERTGNTARAINAMLGAVEAEAIVLYSIIKKDLAKRN